MKTLSMRGQELMSELIAWEMGWSESHPRPLIREILLPDLSILMANSGVLSILSEIVGTPCKAVAVLLEVELLYRQGKLQGDWLLTEDAPRWKLSYTRTGALPAAVVRYIERFCDSTSP
jgi:hypothetical protein